MDFTFTPEQDEAAGLAAKILKDRATNERMKAVEADGDRASTTSCGPSSARRGLLGLALPEEYDGAGLGLVELCRVLVEVGRTVAPVPLAAHGPASRLLAELAATSQGPVAARRGLRRAGADRGGRRGPRVRSRAADHGRTADGDGFRLTGTKTIVRGRPAAPTRSWCPPRPRTGVAVFLVEPGDEGVTVTAQTVLRRRRGRPRRPVRRRGLDRPAGRPGRRVGAAAARHLLLVAGAAEQLGITEGALGLTAAYAKTREQFGRPIGTFQAVSQRLADGYIDTLGQRLTLWQAAWRLDEGLPADTEVATAKLWAADAGHRIAHTTVHVHGGVGIDLDGEAHRYFTAAKRFEFLHGGATQQALHIGKTLAAEPA